MVHELKTYPKYFNRIHEQTKMFEVRKDDRDFQVNDKLDLREYDPETEEYTGRKLWVTVTYILHGGQFGIEEGYCILSLGDIKY